MIKMKWSAVVVASLLWMSLGMLVLGGCQNAANEGQDTSNSMEFQQNYPLMDTWVIT